jgi:hypothetical protein
MVAAKPPLNGGRFLSIATPVVLGVLIALTGVIYTNVMLRLDTIENVATANRLAIAERQDLMRAASETIKTVNAIERRIDVIEERSRQTERFMVNIEANLSKINEQWQRFWTMRGGGQLPPSGRLAPTEGPP